MSFFAAVPPLLHLFGSGQILKDRFQSSSGFQGRTQGLLHSRYKRGGFADQQLQAVGFFVQAPLFHVFHDVFGQVLGLGVVDGFREVGVAGQPLQGSSFLDVAGRC